MVMIPYETMSKSQLVEVAKLQQNAVQKVITERDNYKNELQWERELFNNPTIPPTDKLIMWETTPVPIKRGLPYDFEQPKSHACIKSKAERIGISADTYGSRVRKLATVGAVFEHEYRYEEMNGHTTPSVYLAPTPLLAKPKDIDLPKTGAGHGGKRIKRCTCGSANLVEIREIVCADCGTVYSERKTRPINAPEDINRQDDGWEGEGNLDPLSPGNLPDIVTSSNTTPSSVPEVSPVILPVDTFSLETWLEKRIGEGQTIYSTGILDQGRKYYSFPVGHTLDIPSYLAGKRRHIYGSPLRLADGTTNVLTFDIDAKDAEHYARRHEYMAALSAAGAAVANWLRRDGTCHIEIYLDTPTNAAAVRAWCISVYPPLADIEECYPTNQKNKGRVSWPLYHRIGDKVMACRVEFMFPDRPGELVEHPGIVADRPGLQRLLSRAVTLAALIPELEVVEQVDDNAPQVGGVLLDIPLPMRPSCFNGDGMAKVAIAEFKAIHSWDYVTGQTVQNGRFCATWRGDDTPSVVINKDGNTATDYGRTASGRAECRDKFDTWLLVKGLNKTDEVKRLIAEYHNRRIAS